MHIPDGYLGPSTYGACWAIMLPFWSFASRKVKDTVKTAQIPYLAMGSVFSLLAMMFVLPLPGGTTGHISGTALLSILLGPWASVIAISVSLIIQAIVLGEGGITAIGANSMNIAVIGSLSGAAIFAILNRILRVLKIKDSIQIPLAGATAAYLAINLGALSTSILLGIQPLIYGKDASSGYFPFPLSVVIPATLIPHLTVIGALEAMITAAVLRFLTKRGFPVKGIT